MLVLLEMELIALQLKSTMNASLENTIVTHLIHASISHRVSSLIRVLSQWGMTNAAGFETTG